MFYKLRQYIKMKYEQFILQEVDRLNLNELTFTVKTSEMEDKLERAMDENWLLREENDYLRLYNVKVEELEERIEKLEEENRELERENDAIGVELCEEKYKNYKLMDKLWPLEEG